MQKAAWLFILCLPLFLAGCMQQVLTEVPSFSGEVVDAATGAPLANVTFNEGVTETNGNFSLPAKTKRVWNFPIPGTGSLVYRHLTFHKRGYRDTPCFSGNFAYFGEENHATIPLTHIDQSETPSEPPVFLRLNLNIKCQAFVGSWVRYEGKTYLIGKIYTRKHDDYSETLFSLLPVPPNRGDIIMDINDTELMLTTKNGE
jgi:hypothetical protein